MSHMRQGFKLSVWLSWLLFLMRLSIGSIAVVLVIVLTVPISAAILAVSMAAAPISFMCIKYLGRRNTLRKGRGWLGSDEQQQEHVGG